MDRDDEGQTPVQFTRREAICGLTTAAAASLAGCSRLTKRPLGDPAVESDEWSTTHTYSVEENRIAKVHGDAGPISTHHQSRYPFQLATWQADGYHLERLRYVIEPVRHDVRVEFYLERPGFRGVQFSGGEANDSTVLSIPDRWFHDYGSTMFRFILAVYEDEPFDLRVQYELTLDREGVPSLGYKLDHQLELTLPGRAALRDE